jgi:hypothetical protein
MNVTVPELLAAIIAKSQSLNITVPELVNRASRSLQEVGSNIPKVSVYELLLETGKYIQENPGTFAFQAGGAAVAVGAAAVMPVLGAIGFTTIGPVAGSAAAAWQSSIGLVQAGSLFAWCQSVAMGGWAAGGIMTTGVAVAGAATMTKILELSERLRVFSGEGEYGGGN